jgi:hypothetical protein
VTAILAVQSGTKPLGGAPLKSKKRAIHFCRKMNWILPLAGSARCPPQLNDVQRQKKRFWKFIVEEMRDESQLQKLPSEFVLK